MKRFFLVMTLIFVSILVSLPVGATDGPRTVSVPEHAILFVIDGLSYKTWDHMTLPVLDRLIGRGVLVERVYLPPAAHPHTGEYARIHTCSIPNPIMMSGTVFIDHDTHYLAESFFPGKTTAFAVNSLAYQSISSHYHYTYQKSGSDGDAIEWGLRFMESGNPAFMRVHLQNPGGAGYRSLATDENVSWRRNIWADDSPYRTSLASADSLLGEFIEGLKKLDVWESTVIIVLGDHGQNDGGWHPLEFEDSSITTAVMYGPGIKKGVRVPYAELIDVVPTICTLMQVDIPETSIGRTVAEALTVPVDNVTPRGHNIRDMLAQFAEYRKKAADARYLIERADVAEQGRYFMRFNREIDRQFYDVHDFTEWGRFESIEALLDHNRKVLMLLDGMLDELRNVK